jgi:predicted MFS family arabinose efflux permease
VTGALGERNFRLLLAARTISFFGSNLVPIAVAFAVLDMTGSATDVGISFAARTLAQIGTLLVGGVVADRLSRQRVMIGSEGASMVVQLVLGVLLVTGSATMWELFALQALGGASFAFFTPASAGLVPQTVAGEARRQANGLMSVARYSAYVVGAAVGGALVATIGSGWAILADAGTFALSVLLLTQIRLPGRAAMMQAPRFLRDLTDGWHAFTEHTWVWVLTAWISFYFLISYAPFFVLGPYVAMQSMHGAAGWATVLTGEAVGSLAGALAGIRVRPRRPLLSIGLVFLVTDLQLVLLAARAPLVSVAVAAVFAGFAFSLGGVVFETELQRSVEPSKLSRVSAYNWMGAMAFLPAGYAIAGPLASWIGVSTALWLGAGWLVVSTALILLVRDVRTHGAEPAQAPDSGAAAYDLGS